MVACRAHRECSFANGDDDFRPCHAVIDSRPQLHMAAAIAMRIHRIEAKPRSAGARRRADGTERQLLHQVPVAKDRGDVLNRP